MSDTLQQRIVQLEEDARIFQEKIDKLHQALAVLREANSWYANAKNYDVSINGDSPCFDDADNFPENARFGKKARQAKAKVEEILG